MDSTGEVWSFSQNADGDWTRETADANAYESAGTKETRYHYTVNLNEVGFVDATKLTAKEYGSLELDGGIYYGSITQVISSAGDVVFANNGGWNGGAVYMGGTGTLTMHEHTERGDWHGPVMTGNQAWSGSSGGAVYIDRNATMVMKDGYITNNWIRIISAPCPAASAAVCWAVLTAGARLVLPTGAAQRMAVRSTRHCWPQGYHHRHVHHRPDQPSHVGSKESGQQQGKPGCGGV